MLIHQEANQDIQRGIKMSPYVLIAIMDLSLITKTEKSWINLHSGIVRQSKFYINWSQNLIVNCRTAQYIELKSPRFSIMQIKIKIMIYIKEWEHLNKQFWCSNSNYCKKRCNSEINNNTTFENWNFQIKERPLSILNTSINKFQRLSQCFLQLKFVSLLLKILCTEYRLLQRKHHKFTLQHRIKYFSLRINKNQFNLKYYPQLKSRHQSSNKNLWKQILNRFQNFYFQESNRNVTISLTLERDIIARYQKMVSLQKEENGWVTAGLFM